MQDKKNKIAHSFVPFAYHIMKAENAEGLKQGMHALKSAIRAEFGIELEFTTFCADHSWPFYNAIKEVSVDVLLFAGLCP